MPEEPSAEDLALWQRRLASHANNRAWALAEALSRSADEDEQMLQAAHAAMHLWRPVGNARNLAHAAQLLAHVYALLRLAHPAQHYQTRSQPVFFAADADPWERALAHVVAANVAAASHDAGAHRQHYDRASALIDALPDAEDKRILQAALRPVPVPGAGQHAA